jgi:uncharacterized protein (DUF2164 family)
MSIELPKDIQTEALDSIVRYFRENREEEIGNIAASELLRFFLKEIAPIVYNQAVADVQARMQLHVADLDIEFHEAQFQYWIERKRKDR